MKNRYDRRHIPLLLNPGDLVTLKLHHGYRVSGVKNKKLSIRPECEPCKPFGVATWRTVGAVRDIRVRGLTEAEKGMAEKK